MRFVSVVLLTGMAAFGLADASLAQVKPPYPMCPFGQIWDEDEGRCVPRPRPPRPGKPDPGEGWPPGLPGNESGVVCQWQSGPRAGGYFFCPNSGITNPRPR